ncbi:helix-hairpin-helix domain-containing protein [Haloplanus vescus]|uniref:helix-hairpin-helix domain-containing protein n=1 Tax=Haloplanus vescus TaxID=555874 RepID=UPI0015A47B9D|nr:helix-hairpin-helix domain-containing protein [Haloplanus vescus]
MNDSLEESLDEFWTGLPEEYEIPSEDAEEDEQTKLASLGAPPEGFSRAFEMANRLHEKIQEPQRYQTQQTQFTPETSIRTVVDEIPRAGPVIVTNLENEGYETLGDLEGVSNRELMRVNRVGTETAERLIEFTQNQIPGDRDWNRASDRSAISNDVELRKISEQIPGFGDTSRKKIEKEGYETVGDVRAATANELTDIKQIGEGTVSKLLDYIENNSGEPSPIADKQIPDDTSIEDFAADVPSVGRVLISKLTQEGYETVGDLRTATIEDLTNVEHIGEKKAESLLEHAGLRM